MSPRSFIRDAWLVASSDGAALLILFWGLDMTNGPVGGSAGSACHLPWCGVVPVLAGAFSGGLPPTGRLRHSCDNVVVARRGVVLTERTDSSMLLCL